MEKNAFKLSPLQIFTVNGLCGSGKTTAALKWAVEESKQGERICFVLSTNDQIEEKIADAERLATGKTILIHQITSLVNGNGNVVKEIIDFLKRPGITTGALLFITHEAFIRLPYFNRPSDWTIIIDEEPKYPKAFSWNLPASSSLISSYLGVKEFNPLIYELIRSPSVTKKDFDQYVDRLSKDDLGQQVKELFQHVRNPKIRVLIEKQVWERHHLKSSKRDVKFTVVSILSPRFLRKFKRVIMMSAMLSDCLMIKVWKNQGVEFLSFDPIQNQVGDIKHLNKSYLTLKYLTTGMWSKKRYTTDVTHKGTASRLIDHLTNAIKEEFKAEEYLVYANTSEKSLFKDPLTTVLSGLPEGINAHRNITKVAILGAFNPIPSAFPILKQLGLSSDDITIGNNNLKCYQALMRCALRKADNTIDVTAIVPNKEMAMWLSPYFDNCTVEALDGVPVVKESKRGRKKKSNARSNNERKARSERNNKIAGWEDLVLGSKNGIINSYYTKGISDPYFNTNSPTISIQLFPTRRSLPDKKHSRTFKNINDFIDFLRKEHRNRITSKDDQWLLSPCIFGDRLRDDGLRERTYDNVLYCWGLWIDIDGGDLGPQEFLSLLPDTTMYAFNSFTGGRYRVFIPTSEILTTWAYEDLLRSIRGVVEHAGFRIGKVIPDLDLPYCDWDQSKMGANSLFYLPSRANSKKRKDTFFLSQERNILDVRWWLNNPQHYGKEDLAKLDIELASADEQDPSVVVDTWKVSNFISEYQATPKKEGKRNPAFFHLGLKLWQLGMSLVEVKDQLVTADYDGSRRKKGQIVPVIRSLQRYIQNGTLRRRNAGKES